MIGAQVSTSQREKIESYVKIGRDEGAEVLIGGKRPGLNGRLDGGYYFEPTVLKGHNAMRVFQEEIFGPVLAVTTSRDEQEALEIANDTLYGLGAGVWTRDISRAFCMAARSRPGACGALLSPVSRARGVRRLQGLRSRSRESPDDARPLHADELPARQLRPQPPRVLLDMGAAAHEANAPIAATPAALEVISRLEAAHGPLMFFQSGGCCDGTSPLCLKDGELPLSPDDLRLGEIGGASFYIDAQLYKRWGEPGILIDVRPGAADGFSLEGTEDVRFVTQTP
jgi:uncharacterized protein (DUF779 family)